RMITSGSVRAALDLSREDRRIRDRYGPAREALLARRLVEAGVGCVTLSVRGGDTEWGTHTSHFPKLREDLLPALDHAVATLVWDLHQRGLDRDVVVLVCGEFGRTPRVNRDAGRDHWPNVMSCVLAGGGLRTGQVVGSTTARGEEARARPCTVQ